MEVKCEDCVNLRYEDGAFHCPATKQTLPEKAISVLQRCEFELMVSNLEL